MGIVRGDNGDDQLQVSKEFGVGDGEVAASEWDWRGGGGSRRHD
jgi:hypothetical protein